MAITHLLVLAQGTGAIPPTPPGPVGDPDASNNILLAKAIGNNGNNSTFDDKSASDHLIATAGDTYQGTFSPYTNEGGSAYFDGTGDFLTLTGSTATNLIGQDWTLECWFYQTGFSGVGKTDLIMTTTGTNNWVQYLAIELNQNGTISAAINAAVYTTSETYAQNQWNHVALVRSAGIVKLYLNGEATSISVTSDLPNENFNFFIGKVDNYHGYLYYYKGFISDMLLTKGTAKYTSNFTPSNTPNAVDANTSFLVNCTDGAIVDLSYTQNLKLVGNASSSTTQTKYASSSMHFDGSGDYVSFPITTDNQLGTDDFTIEFWLYFIARGPSGSSLVNNYTTWTSGALGIFAGHTAGNSTKFQVSYNGSGLPNIQSTTSINYNNWQHIALVRSSGTLTLYIDGIANGTLAGATANLTGVNEWKIGYAGDSADYATNGYIEDLRITKGVARYTTNFTPPTSELLGA